MYYGEKLSQERRAEIKELTRQFQSGKVWSVNGKLCRPGKN